MGTPSPIIRRPPAIANAPVCSSSRLFILSPRAHLYTCARQLLQCQRKRFGKGIVYTCVILLCGVSEAHALFCPALVLALAGTPAAMAQGSVEGPLPQLASGKVDQRSPGLTNDIIIRMSKAGLDDSIILQTLRSQPANLHTAPEDLVALKNAGVSQAVIAAMLAKNSGMQMREEKPVEVTPLSPTNDDPGLYYKNAQGQWEMVGPELVKYRDGGAFKSTITNGIIKKDENGVVGGPKSRLKISPGTEMMILAPGPQVDAVEYVILRFHEKPDRREFRVKTGNVFHSESGADKDALDIPIHRSKCTPVRIHGTT